MAPRLGATSSSPTSAPAHSSRHPPLLVRVCFRRFNKARFGSNKSSPSGKMATPSSAPESPPAADPAPAAGAAEGAECRRPQPPQHVRAAPRPRAPGSRGLGAAELGGAAGDAEAPGETFAQRVSWAPGRDPRRPAARSLPGKVTLAPAAGPCAPRGAALCAPPSCSRGPCSALSVPAAAGLLDPRLRPASRRPPPLRSSGCESCCRRHPRGGKRLVGQRKGRQEPTERA